MNGGSKMEIKHQFLAQPSPRDSRDYPVTAVAPKLNTFPSEFRIPYYGVVKNQGEIGSCVAHSLSYTREIQEDEQSGEYKKFSVGFIYGNRQPGDLQDEGMYPREALNGLVKYGVVTNDLFPYNLTYPQVKQKLLPIMPSLIEQAKPYRISSYFRINTIDELKSALMNVGPVTGCFPIWESIYTVNSLNTIIPMPPKMDTPTNKFLGYHEMTVVGWRSDGNLIILNSWGAEWADKGYAYMNPNYPVAEFWGITDQITRDNVTETGYFTLLIQQFITIKDLAFSYAEDLKGRGLKDTFVMFNEESQIYEIHVGYFTDTNSPVIAETMDKLNSLNIPCTLVNRGQ
jgi:hypothetical protein